MDQQTPTPETTAKPDTYEPPCIERVVTSDELAREVQYAGAISQDSNG